MKRYLFLFLIFFLFQNLQAQKRLYFDDNGNKIGEKEFLKKWRDKKNSFSSWHYIGKDKKHHAILKKDLYVAGVLDYDIIRKELQVISGNETKDNTIILLEYTFKDDLCNSTYDNEWTESEVNKRKKFLKSQRKDIEKDARIIYINLFEKSIILKNNINSDDEYFYTDKNYFFRNTIFKNPTLCGSFALIKPNGQCLIRNGEYRADKMAQHLKPENWKLFFDTKE